MWERFPTAMAICGDRWRRFNRGMIRSYGAMDSINSRVAFKRLSASGISSK